MSNTLGHMTSVSICISSLLINVFIKHVNIKFWTRQSMLCPLRQNLIVLQIVLIKVSFFTTNNPIHELYKSDIHIFWINKKYSCALMSGFWAISISKTPYSCQSTTLISIYTNVGTVIFSWMPNCTTVKSRCNRYNQEISFLNLVFYSFWKCDARKCIVWICNN